VAFGLNKRNENILRAIVRSYLIHAEPVGSRTISRQFNLGLSPATIRNTMSDLEEMGYLAQPHTSAGRLPTDKGYRYYVDSLMDKMILSSEEEAQIKKGCLRKGSERDDLMESTSMVLSRASRQAGLVALSGLTYIVLKHIHFVKLSSRQLLVVIVSETGLVQNRIIKIEDEFAQEKLDELSKYLNDQFEGLTLDQIRENIYEKIALEKARYDSLFEKELKLIKKVFKKEKTSANVYVGGTSNIFDQPEFRDDLEKMRTIVSALEEKDRLVKILNRCIEEDNINVIIGSENDLEDLRDCTLVTKKYQYGEGLAGVLGIIGSKRMEYPRVVAIVDYTAQLLSGLPAKG